MQVVTLNLNGIRSATTKGVLPLLSSWQLHAVCLQEVRAFTLPEPWQELGLHSYVYPAKKAGYSGVALLLRDQPLAVHYGLGHPEFDAEGRVLRADWADWSLISVYVPSGSAGPQRQSFKMDFLQALHAYVQGLLWQGRQILLCGDFNIAHQPVDLKNWRSNQNNSGFLPQERAWLDSFLQLGLVDVHRLLLGPHTPQYTWWSHRGQARAKDVGWRLDYQLATPQLAQRATKALVVPLPRLSDHAPLWVHYAAPT